MSQYWIRFRDGQESGPYSATNLRTMIASGHIKRDCLIRRLGEGEPWRAVSSIARVKFPDHAPRDATRGGGPACTTSTRIGGAPDTPTRSECHKPIGDCSFFAKVPSGSRCWTRVPRASPAGRRILRHSCNGVVLHDRQSANWTDDVAAVSRTCGPR